MRKHAEVFMQMTNMEHLTTRLIDVFEQFKMNKKTTYFKTITASSDENGSDTDGYHPYHICFHIFGRIRIRIRIMSIIMSDKIQLDVDIINIRFKYSDTDTISDVEYSDSDMGRSEPSK